MRDHPGAKAKLAGLAVRMEWDPRTTGLGDGLGPRRAAHVGAAALHVAALRARRCRALLRAAAFVALALLLLAYQTLAAVVFVGATRYRVATDFLLALLAAAVFERLFGRRRARA